MFSGASRGPRQAKGSTGGCSLPAGETLLISLASILCSLCFYSDICTLILSTMDSAFCDSEDHSLRHTPNGNTPKAPQCPRGSSVAQQRHMLVYVSAAPQGRPLNYLERFLQSPPKGTELPSLRCRSFASHPARRKQAWCSRKSHGPGRQGPTFTVSYCLCIRSYAGC